MIKQKKGNIINTASISGFIVNNPQPQASYNTAKAGVIMMTKCLAAEWTKYNIRVNAICPGYIRTAMTEEAFSTKLKGSGSLAEKWLELTPMGRMGEPSELKGLTLFLASKASSYITGSAIVIDGGYTCW
jgi:NAD(P)-dependent dehydrogenase (short-subunit alcohol dehydrogenase family)